MNWILIIYVYAGVFAKGDSVAIASITGFETQNMCAAAGDANRNLVKDSLKEYRFNCVRSK
jgi:hypothetical protein